MPPTSATDLFVLGQMGSITELPQLAETRVPPNMIRNRKVFRTGTFKNSRGIETTWSDSDLDAMVQNFEKMKAKGIFPKAPIREDHTQSVKNVVGWFNTLRHDGSHLVTDLALTDPHSKYDESWPVSLEVGSYTSNDGERFEPAVLGVAFVDIPAVEGLYGKADEGVHFFHANFNQGEQVHTFRVNGADTTDPAAVQAHIADLEKFQAEHKPHTFRIQGAETQDFAAVQAHVDTLETAISEGAKVARSDFVAGLAKANKIAATQVEGLTTFSQTLTDEQYTAWKAGYEAAPALSMLGEHGNGVTNKDGASGTAGGLSEFAKVKEIVETHRRSGMSEDAIKKTPSYQRLTELTAAGAGR